MKKVKGSKCWHQMNGNNKHPRSNVPREEPKQAAHAEPHPPGL